MRRKIGVGGLGYQQIVIVERVSGSLRYEEAR